METKVSAEGLESSRISRDDPNIRPFEGARAEDQAREDKSDDFGDGDHLIEAKVEADSDVDSCDGE